MKSNQSLPTWMQTNQDYAAPADADAFIDRSLRAFLGLLAKLRRRPKHSSAPVFHPGVALASALAGIILVALGDRAGFLALCAVIALSGLSLLPAASLARVLATALCAGFLSLIIILPAFFLGGAGPFLWIPGKIVINLVFLGLVSETQNWAGLSAGLASLRLPGLVILVLDLALRYINFLGDFSLAMLQALRLRSVGRNRDKSASLSGIIGCLFLKSRQMALECHAAMVCRGFSANYRPAAHLRLAWPDLVLGLAVLGLVAAFAVLR